MAKTQSNNGKVYKSTKPTAVQKRSINVAALFNHNSKNPQDNDLQDQKAAHSMSQRSKLPPSPDYLEFLKASVSYSESANLNLLAALETERTVLTARVKGLDIHGQPLNLPGVLPLSAFGELNARAAALARPLADEPIPVEIIKPSGRILHQQQALGDTVAQFRSATGRLLAKLRTMLQEREAVDAEIEEILEGLGVDAKAMAEFEREIEGLERAADKALNDTIAEAVAARKEDKSSTMEANRRVQEFVKSFG